MICRVAPVHDAMAKQLQTFAQQVVSFTAQYKRMDLLWKVTQLLDPKVLASTTPHSFLQIAKALKE